jgi:C1A family cysteine protease
MTSEELDRNIVRIKKDILDNGPVSAAMIVYNDFLHYKGGVYEHPHGSTDKPVGGHAVTIQGWGKDDNGEYWICKNSWGTKWGLQGFWHHRIGDASLIESNCHSGLPDTRSQFHPIVGELAEKCNRHFVPIKGDGDSNNKS